MPRFVDVELTNVCNFRCLMCWGQTSEIKRKKGFMSEAVFERIESQLSLSKIPVRFIRWGEPFLHPHILPWIRRLHSAGIPVHINTNGSVLTDEVIRELIGIPLDSLKFSFQGVDRAGYSDMRNKDNFVQLLETISRFATLRGDRALPYLHISTTITDEPASVIDAFKNQAKNLVDLVTIGRTVLEHINADSVMLTSEERKRLQHLKRHETVIKKHPDCPEVFDKMSINFDGTVSACCTDFDDKMIVGDIMTQSIEEIWFGAKLSFYRKELAAMNHDRFILCRSCYDYIEQETPGVQQLNE